MTLVLIVEDDQNILDALEAVVRGDGYRVCTAADGEKAMKSVAQERPDVVISDLMMPRMDGSELVRALAAVPALANIPVIMTSAATRPPLALHAFLPKPVAGEKLLEVLHGACAP